MAKFNLYHYISETSVLGPGKRFVLWVQGCSRRCKGCIAPDAQSGTGTLMEVSEVFSKIKESKNITGITISGGEPFEQEEALCELVKMIKTETRLDIIVFSGYLHEELVAKNTVFVNTILQNIDLLVDGEYKEELNNGEYLRGSSNQRFVFLSHKFYGLEKDLYSLKNRNFDILIDNNGMIFVAGIPPKKS